MKAFEPDEWEEWRQHPVTRAVLAEVQAARAQRLESLAAEASGGDEKTVRASGGYVRALKWALDLINSKGEQNGESK